MTTYYLLIGKVHCLVIPKFRRLTYDNEDDVSDNTISVRILHELIENAGLNIDGRNLCNVRMCAALEQKL